MRRIFLLTALVALAPVPASADWQNTTWEMNREQVIRATGAVAHAGTEGESVAGADLGAKGTYAALGFEFESQFFFDRTDRLRMVKLVLNETSRCEELRSSVEGIYGRPLEGRRQSFVWIDGKSGDRVRYTDARMPPVVNECFLTYQPGLPSGAQGL